MRKVSIVRARKNTKYFNTDNTYHFIIVGVQLPRDKKRLKTQEIGTPAFF